MGVKNLDPSLAQDRGKPARYSMRLGLAFSGSMMWEIVQPLTGPNIYEEFLERHGEGIHHVAFGCNGIPWNERLKVFADHGYQMIQSGRWQGRAPYAYFETEDDTTTTFEKVMKVPARSRLERLDRWLWLPPLRYQMLRYWNTRRALEALAAASRAGRKPRGRPGRRQVRIRG